MPSLQIILVKKYSLKRCVLSLHLLSFSLQCSNPGIILPTFKIIWGFNLIRTFRLHYHLLFLSTVYLLYNGEIILTVEHFHCDCAHIISFYGPRGFQSGIKWYCRWSFKSSFEHFSKGSLINLLFQGHTVRINLPLVYYRTVFTVGWKAEISRWITRRQMRKLREVCLGHVTHLNDIRGWYQWHR